MEKKNYNVIGVMSGTSLDGVDLAFVKIGISPSFSAKIIMAETVPYSQEWVTVLTKALHFSEKALKDLNVKYTNYLSQVIKTFIKKNNLKGIDVISSHGHTILHQPSIGLTLQIGNLPQIASLTGHKVVCDFRVQDLQLRGQGAPLVPIGDQLLFDEYEYCLNLGGFANVSTRQNDTRIAYDICAVNTVLNFYAQMLGKAYDDKGAFAKAGTLHLQLLQELNELSFYSHSPPKSLGIEWVHKNIFPLIDSFNLTPQDVLATYTEHVAVQISNQFSSGSIVLITGGGAFNSYLIELLNAKSSLQIILPDTNLIEYKEALIFGLLGVLKLEGKVNTLASVTGASKDHSAGKIYLP